MDKYHYKLPENLVLRICGWFEDKELGDKDYFPEGSKEGAENLLLHDLDKEYATKSRLIGLTNQGIVEYSCCPVHVNEGLIPVMQTIRECFPKIGKGNIGFGSTFYACDPGKDVSDNKIVKAQKVIGGFANLAREYQNEQYLHALAEHQMIPLLVSTEEAGALFQKDSYLLLKDVRANLEFGKELEAYAVRIGEGLKPISVKKALRNETDLKLLLN